MSEITLAEMILGFGLMIGLALLFSVMVNYKQNEEVNIELSHFVAFATIFCAFVVWGGLLESWVLILMVIILSFVLVYEFKIKKTGE